MKKGIYTYYKERLTEIGGSNQSLYLDDVKDKSMYDLGRIFEGRDDKLTELADFLWSGEKRTLTVIDKSEKNDIIQNLEQGMKAAALGKTDDQDSDEKTYNRIKKVKEEKFTLENEVKKIKKIVREADEVERETGRYETYLGYPFVFGCIPEGTSKALIKAPLIFFPIKIDIKNDTTVEISLNENEKIQINPALVYAYSQFRKTKADDIRFEYDSVPEMFKSVSDVVAYLGKARIKIGYQPSKNIFGYSKFKEPETRLGLSVRFAAVIGRFILSNSVYNDYLILEKKKLYNEAVEDLLKNEKSKKKSEAKRKNKEINAPSYTVTMLDCARSEIIKKVDEKKNTVIYGPPGTGKSQTIINLIADAICKSKRVLVVSHKKSALDAVYHRLGILNECAMYITGEAKERRTFYDKCMEAHQNNALIGIKDTAKLEEEYIGLESQINGETEKLSTIYALLNTPLPFGLSPKEMYNSSYKFKTSSSEYSIYNKMLNYSDLMSLNYNELDSAINSIRSQNLGETFFRYTQEKEKNPIIDCILTDASMNTLSEVKGILEGISKSKKDLFDTSIYPYYKQVLAYYPMIKRGEKIDHIVKMHCKLKKPKQLFIGKSRRITKARFIDTFDAIERYIKEFNCIYKVLTPDGCLSFIDNVLSGNLAYIEKLADALRKYMADKDFHSLPIYLDSNKECILSFAYSESKNYQGYCNILDNLLKIRIYHEILEFENANSGKLDCISSFNKITERIQKLKDNELTVSRELCLAQHTNKYLTLFEGSKNNKDYLYQISKKHNHIPIKAAMADFGDLLLSLFPCWLLSVDNVSSLLPLQKNMFDIVIFDEASEIFIESVIPTVYRGKTIVVAGDAQQLRPTAGCIRRYLGATPKLKNSHSLSEAFANNSLFDIAAAKYPIINLSYYFGSHSRELIDFSDGLFYNSKLCIAPNISKKPVESPIEIYKTDGIWKNGTILSEAQKTAEVLREILKTRKNNESIGIITFNQNQQSYIADVIESEALHDEEFKAALGKERNRTDGGLYSGLFIKSAENVQGDERDVIIISLGYAKDESGKLCTPFDESTYPRGENIINVALTRARSKIILITSIEPEDIECVDDKHTLQKLFKYYLTYAKAVSESDKKTLSSILNSIRKEETVTAKRVTDTVPIETEMKERLEERGYKVDTSLGSMNSRISLAIYDQKARKYVLGIELDTDTLPPDLPHLERDIYKRDFLEAHGWRIMRVWCRDWWHNPVKVLDSIERAVKQTEKTV